MKYDLIIIGSGSVGSAAGYYATQAGLKVLMIERPPSPPTLKEAITAIPV
jgi:N-methyl-L-tryptophan oxidase